MIDIHPTKHAGQNLNGTGSFNGHTWVVVDQGIAPCTKISNMEICAPWNNIYHKMAM